MPSDPNQIVQFAQPAADKIVKAVKQVLAAPGGGAGSRATTRAYDNRIFWARRNTSAGTFVEIFQSSNTGSLVWADLPNGRTGDLSNLTVAYGGVTPTRLTPPNGNTMQTSGRFLVYQWFDAAASNGGAYYYAIGDSTCVVKISGTLTPQGVYSGTIEEITFGSGATPTFPSFVDGIGCYIINLEEMTYGVTGTNKHMLGASGTQFCTGNIIDTTSDGTCVVAINNGQIDGGAVAALATGDEWVWPTGVGTSGCTGFSFPVVTTVTTSSGLVTAVKQRTVTVDARGRVLRVTAEF